MGLEIALQGRLVSRRSGTVTAPPQPTLWRGRALILGAVALVALVALVVGLLWVRNASGPTSTDAAPVTTAAAPSSPSATIASQPASPTPATTTIDSPKPSASAVPPTPTAEATQQFLGAGHTATFRYFEVTVLNEAPAAPVDNKGGLKVRVCVRELPPGSTGVVRVSRDPWRLVSDKDISLTPATSGLYEPAFPVETTKAVGQCQEGFLTFSIPPDFFNDSSNLVYANGVGETASWNFH
jgi:hypothetical protein